MSTRPFTFHDTLQSSLEEFIAIRKDQAANQIITEGSDAEKRNKFMYALLSLIDPNFAKLVISHPKLQHAISIAFVTKDERSDYTENYECLEFLGDKYVNLLVVNTARWENPSQGTLAVQKFSSKNIQHNLSNSLNLFDLLSPAARGRQNGETEKKPRIDIYESLFGLLHTIIQEVVNDDSSDGFAIIRLNPDLLVKVLRFPQRLLAALLQSVNADVEKTSSVSYKTMFPNFIRSLGYDPSTSNWSIKTVVEHGKNILIIGFGKNVVDDINSMRLPGMPSLEETALSVVHHGTYSEFRFAELDTEEETMQVMWNKIGLTEICKRTDIYDLKSHVLKMIDEEHATIPVFKALFLRTAAVKLSYRVDPNGSETENVRFNDQIFPPNTNLFIRFKKDRVSPALDLSYLLSKLVRNNVTEPMDFRLIGNVSSRLQSYLTE